MAEALLSLQLEAEEKVGFVMRQYAAMAKATEDAVLAKLRAAS